MQNDINGLQFAVNAVVMFESSSAAIGWQALAAAVGAAGCRLPWYLGQCKPFGASKTEHDCLLAC